MNNPIAWLWLMLAIIGEVVATTSLKASKELTVLWPSVMIVIGYLFSFYFMILTMRHLPVSLTYAFWSAAGIIFITIAAAVRFNEKPDLPAVIGISMIVGGVLVITIFFKNEGQLAAGKADRLDMDGTPVDSQSRFLDRFVDRRMRMAGTGNIFG